jgi:hypothetical protein
MRVQEAKGSTPDENRRLVYALPRSVVTVDIPLTRTVTQPGACNDPAVLNELLEPAPEVKDGSETAAKAAKGKADAAKNTPAKPPQGKPAQDTSLLGQASGKAGASVKILDLLAHLNIKIPKESTSSSMEVGDVVVAQRMEPDPARVYAVILEPDLLKNEKFAFELTENGLLSAGSLESSNRVVDTAAKVLPAIASIAAGVIGFAGDKAKPTHCREVLDRLIQTRVGREALLRGDAQVAGTPKDTLELMLAELKAVENAYAAEFTGKKTVVKGVARCEVHVTDKTDTAIKDNYSLLSYDSRHVTNASHCVVSPELLEVPTIDNTRIPADTKTPAAKPPKTVQLSLVANASFAREAERFEPKSGESGLYYRIPVRATVSVLDGAVEKARTLLDIPQYGSVVSLPGDADVNGTSLAVAAKFGAAGGLVSYTHSSTGPDTAALAEAAGTAGKTALDALKTRQNADVEALEREKKRLELLQQIEKLKAGQSLEE